MFTAYQLIMSLQFYWHICLFKWKSTIAVPHVSYKSVTHTHNMNIVIIFHTVMLCCASIRSESYLFFFQEWLSVGL